MIKAFNAKFSKQFVTINQMFQVTGKANITVLFNEESNSNEKLPFPLLFKSFI